MGHAIEQDKKASLIKMFFPQPHSILSLKERLNFQENFAVSLRERVVNGNEGFFFLSFVKWGPTSSCSSVS